MLKSNSKQSRESMWSVLKKKGRLRWEGFAESKNDTKLFPITSPNINRFSNFSLTDSLENLQQTHV